MSEETNFDRENEDTEDIENIENTETETPTEEPTEIENIEDAVDNADGDRELLQPLVIDEEYDELSDTASVEEDEEHESEVQFEPKRRRSLKVSLGACIVSVIAAVLATLMLTYAICGSVYQAKIAQIYAGGGNNANGNGTTLLPDNTGTIISGFSEKTVIDFLLSQYFYEDVDIEALTEESLKAYLEATGDIYAAYYTQDEIDAANQEGSGRMQGVGINIINSVVELGGSEYAVLKITNVMKDSPAQDNGLRAGDLIYSVGNENEKVLINELGYDEALKQLKGAAGTVAEFSILRKSGEKYEEKFFSFTRAEVTTESVYSRVHSQDPKIGIVRILDFELNTPTQFETAIEDLKKQGCEKFVIDVRYNPGGYLISIAAVLSYFLNEGDVYIRTEDRDKNITENKVGVVTKYSGDYEPCNVYKEDIGKYKDLNMVVLCNEYTASAAELFTATFRDYGLGKIVGTTTFGKGKMQTTYSLEPFGLKGAVKFTTNMYYSAKSAGYDGIGIKPDEGCDIPLSEEAKQYNIYDLPDDKDNQLQKAIQQFK